MHAQRVEYTVTRRSRDGGRDAVGYLRIGPAADPVELDFTLEAKRYAMDQGVGVRKIARLVSRIRHRMFGVLVTTSYVDRQAYEELRADGHPVVVIAARDIVELLRERGYATPDAVRAWLVAEFPQDAS